MDALQMGQLYGRGGGGQGAGSGLEAAEIDLAQARHTTILRHAMVIFCKAVAANFLRLVEVRQAAGAR